MKARIPVVSLWLLVILLAAGCSAQPAALETASSQNGADMDSIVETVVARIETRGPDGAATPDVAALQAEVLAAVEERLAATDPEALDRLIDERLAARLAEQEQPQSTAQQAAMEAAGLEERLQVVYRQANPGVVYVIVPPVGTGSGFVYGEDGTIVTNNHVVNGGRTFEVVFATGERLEAELMGTDADSDLAVLRVEGLPEGIVPLALAEPASLAVGQFVIAIGNPFGEQGSMSLGIVSGLDRSLRSQRGSNAGSSYSLPGVVQTDAPINPGNSGGPLLNLSGEVVGVNSAIASETGVNSGVGFAIPVDAVHRIVPDLIAEGEHAYSYMGAGFDEEISLSEQALFELSQASGAYVVNVNPDSPAEQAGLIAADTISGQGGDLIVAIDGAPIRNFSDLNAYLVFRTAVGQTIELSVLRDGEQISLPLTLGERP